MTSLAIMAQQPVEHQDWQEEIQEVSTMEAVLPAGHDEAPGKVLPVWLLSKVTEIGTLELWCVARDEDRRWKLEFNLRGQGSAIHWRRSAARSARMGIELP